MRRPFEKNSANLSANPTRDLDCFILPRPARADMNGRLPVERANARDSPVSRGLASERDQTSMFAMLA
jgi:hypothetical protein